MALSDIDDPERLRAALNEAVRQGERDRATIGALQATVDEARREAQHQVRNILSVVRSIARRTVEDGATAEDYLARFDSRLASFTRLQNYILRDPSGGVDLGTLISDELLAFGIGLGAEVHMEGVDVCVRPKPASILGLAFHELACLAIGSHSSGADPRIVVRWRVETDGIGAGQLRIEWAESGPPADAALEPDAAFGREFLEQAVSYELGGDVRLDAADGTLLCRFRIPVEDVILS